MGAFFSSSFFGSDPTSINPQVAAPTPSSSTGGGSSTLDWLNTIYKFAQLGTQTYIAQDALNTKSSNVVFGPNGQPIQAGTGVAAQGGVNSILGTSSIWLFLFVILLVLLLLKK